jgi:hypothetical protein
MYISVYAIVRNRTLQTPLPFEPFLFLYAYMHTYPFVMDKRSGVLKRSRKRIPENAFFCVHLYSICVNL